MGKVISYLFVCLAVISCSGAAVAPVSRAETDLSLGNVARMLSELPLGTEHLREVYGAAAASSSNGYDEEYLMRDIFEAPGCGVGADRQTRAAAKSAFDNPLRSLITDYYEKKYATKAGAADAEAFIRALTESGYQLYLPYSEDWDGETFPIITFDPGYGAESNYGYELRMTEDGVKVVDSVFVDESVAASRPVWVVNTNDDSAFTPFEAFYKGGSKTKSGGKMLYLKSFKMLRNYDSWFAGASEFFVKCGSVEGFTAKTEADMRLYSPTVTDFMVVVKRRYKKKDLQIGTIMMTDFTDQLESLAFLVTEDDGGTSTNWKCSAAVKVASKTYGIELDIPYNDKDDIVWRGQLSADFLRSANPVTGRFGDVEITFALE